MAKRVRVTGENGSGRNTTFRDDVNHRSMTRAEFVREIERGAYPDYHVRRVNDIKTPVSNPDGRDSNNLG